jgi:ribosomal protein S18 acetylase RimI-like enzyme
MSVDYAEVIKQHEVFVAVSEGRIVGVLVLIRRLETMLLDNVAVHPDFQGQGLGRRLIALAESETKRLRYDEIQLYTNEKMVENIALYSRLGYVEIGRRSEQALQRVYMSKRLAD